MKPAERTIDSILWIGLCVLVAIAPTQYAFEVMPRTYLSPVDPMIWLLLLLWLVRQGWTGLRKLPWPPLPLLLFVALSLVSLGAAGLSLKAGKEVFQTAEYCIAALVVATSILGTRHRIRITVDVFLAAGAIVLSLGAIQYLDPSISTFQVRSTFGNANVFGGFMVLLVPLAWGLFLNELSWWRRLVYLALTLGCLCVTLSGGAALAMVVSLCGVSILCSRRAWLLTTAMLLCMLVWVWPSLPRENADVLVRSTQLHADDNSVSTRYTEWQAAVAMARDNLWVGVGPGLYQDHIGTYYGTLPNPSGTSEPDSQNLYLVLASSLGVPAMLAFLGALLGFAQRAATLAMKSSTAWERGLSAGLWGSLMGFAIASLWSPLFVRGVGACLLLLCAVLLALGRSCDEERPAT